MEKTQKHAELIGLHFGDGSVIQRKGTDRLRFQLRGDATADREHYEQFVIPLCNELVGYPLLGHAVNTVFDKNRNCFGISLESSKLLEFFQALEIPIGKKGELPIPEWIKANAEFSKAFVRGLFDTDGGIYFKKNNTAKSQWPQVINMSIVSTSETLILETAEILRKLEIKHYVTSFMPRKGNLVAYRIGIFKPRVTDFMDRIGSHNPKHLAKYAIWQKFGFCPSRTTPEQRQQILKGELNPISLLSAGVG